MWKFHLCLIVIFFQLQTQATNITSPPIIDLPNLTIGTNGCELTFNVDIDSDIWIVDGQGSVGLFYRLEGGNLGSYFWSETVYYPNVSTSIPKKLILPSGNFELICYQQRKGGPIQTKSFQVTGTGGCSGHFPKILPSSSNVKITPSWNAFVDEFFSNPPTLQQTDETYQVPTPTEPWFFLSLSIANWPSFGLGIDLKYDASILQFDSGIVKNYKDSNFWDYTYIVSNDPVAGILHLNPNNSQPINQETNTHLIFKLKTGIPISKEVISFSGEFVPPAAPGTDTIEVLIKKGPHDPNSLNVDKDKLCPCNCNEILNYQVNFQNKGSDFAEDVEVKWMNSQHLDVSSINLTAPTTTLKNASVNETSGTFSIKSIFLPGTNQYNSATGSFYDYYHTEDNFKFSIKKADCLSIGTIIQPQVGITFISYDPTGKEIRQPQILTNLERTEIVNPVNKEKPCEKNCTTCSGCKMKKKKCWLFRLFAKK